MQKEYIENIKKQNPPEIIDSIINNDLKLFKSLINSFDYSNFVWPENDIICNSEKEFALKIKSFNIFQWVALFRNWKMTKVLLDYDYNPSVFYNGVTATGISGYTYDIKNLILYEKYNKNLLLILKKEHCLNPEKDIYNTTLLHRILERSFFCQDVYDTIENKKLLLTVRLLLRNQLSENNFCLLKDSLNETVLDYTIGSIFFDIINKEISLLEKINLNTNLPNSLNKGKVIKNL